MLVIVVVGILALQRYFTFPRHALRWSGPVAARAGVETLWLDTDQGRVEGWLIPAPGASAATPAPLVIFAHGNGETIADWPEALAGYGRMGVSVLLPEYRGYGRSAGSPSEETLARDFAGFLDLAAARPDVDAERIVLHGRSIGGGVVCALAATRTPAALILQSTFTSLAAIMRRFGVPGILVLDRFDNLAVLGRLDAPVLVVHGERDALIPPDHARALAGAARDATLHWFDGGHNDPPADRPLWDAIRAHLQRSGVLP